MEKKNLCASCKWAKDRWHDACYCVYYGFVVSREKTDCWGHEINGKEDENEQADDHREPDQGA